MNYISMLHILIKACRRLKLTNLDTEGCSHLPCSYSGIFRRRTSLVGWPVRGDPSNPYTLPTSGTLNACIRNGRENRQ